MRPIGIMSIPRAQTPAPERRFDLLMSTAGHNTGNLLFTNAVWQQIRGRKKRIGFQFDPEALNASLKSLVIPAANWLGPHVDFSDLADLIEQLDIPVIMIGLGAQGDTYAENVEVPEGTLRFIRAVAARSHSISVRGNYTKEVLKKHGIKNVTVTGCPSLYQLLQPDAEGKLHLSRKSQHGPTLLHSTRYSIRHRAFLDNPSIHRNIFRQAYKDTAALLLQSEPEEISLITEASEKPEMDCDVKTNLLELYGTKEWITLHDYLLKHASVFFDIGLWSTAMGNYGRIFGTRLHATIMALNSGTPAILIPHDSRTQELCEFAHLPTAQQDNAILDEASIRQYVRMADFDSYFSAQKSNSKLYSNFLTDNGLKGNLTVR